MPFSSWLEVVSSLLTVRATKTSLSRRLSANDECCSPFSIVLVVTPLWLCLVPASPRLASPSFFKKKTCCFFFRQNEKSHSSRPRQQEHCHSYFFLHPLLHASSYCIALDKTLYWIAFQNADSTFQTGR